MNVFRPCAYVPQVHATPAPQHSNRGEGKEEPKTRGNTIFWVHRATDKDTRARAASAYSQATKEQEKHPHRPAQSGKKKGPKA